MTADRYVPSQPPCTEDSDGVWASAAACMRNYLILRDKARAFAALTPEVAEALRAARVDHLALSTLAEGHSCGATSASSARTSTRSVVRAWPSNGWTSSRSSTSTVSARRPPWRPTPRNEGR